MGIAHQLIRSDTTTPATAPTRETLPSLIRRAAERLASARSSAEVLEARAAAEAALHYAKVTEAANETHADCLRIITRAEIRMANELDAGQAAGAVERRGGDRKINARDPGNDPAKLTDLNISSQRASEWRKVRDAGEEAAEAAIQSALDEGRTPTKTGIKEAVGATKPKGTAKFAPAAPKQLSDDQKYARFISLADEFEALDVKAIVRGAGRKRAALMQRASSLVGKINEFLEAAP